MRKHNILKYMFTVYLLHKHNRLKENALLSIKYLKVTKKNLNVTFRLFHVFSVVVITVIQSRLGQFWTWQAPLCKQLRS